MRRVPHLGSPYAVGLAFVFTALIAHAQAPGFQTDNSESLDELGFFHVHVKGNFDGDDPRKVLNGKAFAIGPDLLVTALHVVGHENAWKARAKGAPEIDRAIRPLDRQIILTKWDPNNPAHAQKIQKDAFVQPTSSAAMNAVGIVVPGLDLTKFFKLSLCKIEQGEEYSALMTSHMHPEDPDSMESEPLNIKLLAIGHKVESFGPLFVFEFKDDSEKFISIAKNGHDGSPILDLNGNVVAIISAVTKFKEDFLILATPIRPIFLGSPGLLDFTVDASYVEQSYDETDIEGARCSLPASVKSLHHQVSTHTVLDIERYYSKNYPHVIEKINIGFSSINRNINVDKLDFYIEFKGEMRPQRHADWSNDNPQTIWTWDSYAVRNENWSLTKKFKIDLGDQSEIAQKKSEGVSGKRARIDGISVSFTPETNIGRLGREAFYVPYVDPNASHVGPHALEKSQMWRPDEGWRARPKQ